MSAISDFSLMDVLFGKEDNLKLDKEIKVEIEDEKPLNYDYWQRSSDDFLDSILFNHNFDLLPPDDDTLLQQEPLNSVISSSSSDSGVSCDQQMSPRSQEVKEEDETTSDEQIDVTDDIILDSPVSTFVEQEITTQTCAATTPPSKPVVRVKPSVSKNPPKVIHVSPQNSSRSILIPVNVKNRNCVRTVKIFKSRHGRNAGIRVKNEFSDDEPLTSLTNQGYPALSLTEEERKLMVKEGITLPSHYPLTKEEERELKRIRRKIRNKISAQDSRKRKKEYVDGLEDRVKQCSVENASLLSTVKQLQSENQSLSAQLRRLQAVLAKQQQQQQQGGANQSLACLVVLMLSVALITAAPGIRPDSQDTASLSAASSPLQDQVAASPVGFVDYPVDEVQEEVCVDHVDHDYASTRKRLPSYRLWPPPSPKRFLPSPEYQPPSPCNSSEFSPHHVKIEFLREEDM